VAAHRHGSRKRSLTGTFGPAEVELPRARLNIPEGKTTEWKSQALRAYHRLRNCPNTRRMKEFAELDAMLRIAVIPRISEVRRSKDTLSPPLGRMARCERQSWSGSR
jgi:hypothetical protein